MNDTTRRGFLGLLAHVPGVAFCVGVFVRRPGVASSAPGVCQHQKGPREKGRWLNERDGCGGESCRPLTENEQIIRWIPVSERMPELTLEVHANLPIYRRSEAVLAVVGGSVYPRTVRLLEHLGPRAWWIDGAQMYSENMLDVTHWAELPSPPDSRS